MAPINKAHIADLRGAAQVALDASRGVVDIVERMHRTIQAKPLPLGRGPSTPTRGITGLVYRSVRGVMGLVGQGIDLSLGAASGFLPEGTTPPQRDAVVAALNGLHGDHLLRTGNPLAINMALRHGGQPLDPLNPAAGVKAPTGRVLVLVHGLCMTDAQWRRAGRDHGALLAEAGGFTPVYLRYNSGLHVGDNGERFAALLETLLEHWPVPVRELVVVGHSMGGLVARSACFHAARADHAWPRRLKKLVFLGTPHHGSPLERGGHGLQRVLQWSPYSAPLAALGRSRSAGIQDLRHGAVTRGRPVHVALPPGVACYAVAATLAGRRQPLAERLLGDGLVAVDSALGRHRDPGRTLAFAPSHQFLSHDTGHLELLCRPEVAARLRQWLVPEG
ncbi:MAG: alpha/beta hydrolase [Rubrivivax sp.]|nr:alpha/beta hydrolase [Rubrivivax sp.]